MGEKKTFRKRGITAVYCLMIEASLSVCEIGLCCACVCLYLGIECSRFMKLVCFKSFRQGKKNRQQSAIPPSLIAWMCFGEGGVGRCGKIIAVIVDCYQIMRRDETLIEPWNMEQIVL